MRNSIVRLGRATVALVLFGTGLLMIEAPATRMTPLSDAVPMIFVGWVSARNPPAKSIGGSRLPDPPYYPIAAYLVGLLFVETVVALDLSDQKGPPN